LRELGFSSSAYKGNPVCAFDEFDDADAAVDKIATHALAEGVGGVDAEARGEADGEERRVLVEGGAEHGRRGGHGLSSKEEEQVGGYVGWDMGCRDGDGGMELIIIIFRS